MKLLLHPVDASKEAFAAAAFEVCTRDYLAPPGYPDGAAVLMVVLGPLHEPSTGGANASRALRAASRPSGCADAPRHFRPAWCADLSCGPRRLYLLSV